MNFKLDSTNGGRHIAGSTAIHSMRAEIKICWALVLLAISGLGGGFLLFIPASLALVAAVAADISIKEIYLSIRSMAWFFIAIIIFPILFTPGYFIELPSWLPISISVEGLFLSVESCSRLILVLVISTILIRTTSTSDLMEGLDRSFCNEGWLGNKLKVLVRIAVMSIEVLPLIFHEAENHFKLLDFKTAGNEKRTLIKTVQKAAQQVTPFIVSIFSNIETWNRVALGQRDAGLNEE